MSWQTFKQNVLSVTSNPESINDLELVGTTFAFEYDQAVKRGGDSVNLIPVESGSYELMRSIFISSLQKGLSSTEPYDLVGEMGQGVIEYWRGVKMSSFPIPIEPAVGAAQNVGVFGPNFIIDAGIWKNTVSSNDFTLTDEKRAEYERRLQKVIEDYEAALPVREPEILEAFVDRISMLSNRLISNEEYRVDIPFPGPIVTERTDIVNINGQIVGEVDPDEEELVILTGNYNITTSTEDIVVEEEDDESGNFQQSKPHLPDGATIGERCVQIALADVKDNVREIPDGSNTGHSRLLTIQRTAARSNETSYAWCAAAVFTWWTEGGFPWGADRNDPAYIVNPKHCNNWYNFAVKTGRWVEKRRNQNPNFIPKMGDAVMYSTDFSTLDHMALVYEYKDGVLTSIDGNYANKVAFNKTYNKYIAGYITI